MNDRVILQCVYTLHTKQMKLANQKNQCEFTNETCTKIEEIIGMNPNQIKSTLIRPAMEMRESMKKDGHIGD
ncbi:unnamed protein product [Adineta steineri]|uniref:Uncharacterized protein n=2 Tax=Adineta steineri TaxID=433720 RepID=A0A814QJ44_9BILA|nr:unnamed protein product [Adineta steineri]